MMNIYFGPEEEATEEVETYESDDLQSLQDSDRESLNYARWGA